MSQPASRDDQKLQITLLQERSAGTFARVYLAEARSGGGLSRVVAVKVIKEQWSESHEILTRTRDEARLLSRLQHKNILRVEALAEVDGQPAIVMEFVDGIDLQQLIERLSASTRRIPRRALYKIMSDAISAIAAAWEEVPLNGSGPLRVVHRDLKPSNVMVSKQGEVKVLDFGTARFDFTERQARTGAMRFGSLKYMSPERRQGDRGDHPSDVYALGLLCIEMLQGQMLPVLPLEPVEHDQHLGVVVNRLGDLGLPDARWDDALRQTLRGMIASDSGQRLHASQLISLFRAFADNATGESLDAFAASTIAELTRDVYGGHPGGDLSGSRVFVAMTTSSDLPVPETRPSGLAPVAPPDDPGFGDPGFGDPGFGDPSFGDVDRPTQISVSTTSEERATQVNGIGDYDPPTMVGGIGSPPPRHERSEPLPVTAAPASGPYPEADSVTRPSVDTSGSIIEVAPVAAVAAPTGRSNLVIGAMVAMIVFLIGGLFVAFGATALGMWWYFGQLQATPPLDLAELAEAAEPDPALAEAAGLAGTHAIDVAVDDDMVQWIAIEDDAGTRVFKGSPGGSTSLGEGDYQLLAKVRARATASAPLSVSGPLSLSCASAEKGEVRCDTGGDAALVLVP